MNRKLITLLSVILLANCAVVPGAIGQESVTPIDLNGHKLKGYYWVKPAKDLTPEMIDDLVNGNVTPSLPLWSYSVTSSRDSKVYKGQMVGKSALSTASGATDVPTFIIPIILKTEVIGTSVNSDGSINTKTGNTTFNPTVADTKCLASPNNVPEKLVQQSPIFNNASFTFGGTNVGTTQYIDAFQRANFWKKINTTNYHVLLSPVTTLSPITVTVTSSAGVGMAAAVFGTCDPFAVIDINVWDSFVTGTLLPSLASSGVNASTFPIFVVYNTAWSNGPPNLATCCILGYHGSNGAQTYSSTNFDTTGLFDPGSHDTATMSHEVAEWMNDPFGNNPTPSWGHTGQVSGCQNNLEVGDPLSGQLAPSVIMSNGYTYHLQELAFFNWFYGGTNSGVNGWYSDNDNFYKNAGAICH